tara:strand:+ start:138 stop:722 length:585 start_codon:yes stop_codon:yes gene_type:complete
MKKLIFIFFIIPFFTYSQLVISTKLIEITDAKREINKVLDFSIGSFINNKTIVGITNEQAVADYIKAGFNPVQDSLIVSNFQLFFKYYNKDYFVLMKIPISSDIRDISIFDRTRFGGGYIFYSYNDLEFDISYDFLLSSNLNGWNKGKLGIGITASTDITFPSISTNLFNKLVNWINTPLSNGYRESMYLSKSK